MNSFWFHEKCQSILFITFKHHHVSAANEPKRAGGLSPPTPTLLAPLLHLSKLWAPIALPKGGQREKAGDVLSAAQLSGTAQLAAQAHCLSMSFQVTSINILFSPLSGPWAPPPPSAPTSPWIGRLSSNKCFISCIDGYLGIAAPVKHQIEHHAHFNLRGDRLSLAEMKCGWLQFLPAAHGAVRPFGLWEQCQEGPEENRGIPSLWCKDGDRGGCGGPCDRWRENQEPASHLPQEVETQIPRGPDR